MSTEREYFAVDRIASGVAVLISDSGQAIEVDRDLLPEGIQAGSVLRAGKDETGGIRWDTAELDEAERTRRVTEARRVLDELKKRDPGGDLDL